MKDKTQKSYEIPIPRESDYIRLFLLIGMFLFFFKQIGKITT
jgi:hypothetical protein